MLSKLAFFNDIVSSEWYQVQNVFKSKLPKSFDCSHQSKNVKFVTETGHFFVNQIKIPVSNIVNGQYKDQ